MSASPSPQPITASVDSADSVEARKTPPAITFAGLFLLALLVQIVAFKRSCGPYDEFLTLYGSDRILHGGVPYRDFWTMYGPAQFYVVALFFKLFGVSALTGRIYDALIRSAIACASFYLARLLTTTRWAFAAYAAVILWLAGIYYPAYNFPVYPAMLASLVSCIFFTRFLEQPSRTRSLFLAGLCVSIATIFRHDSGFYIFLAELFVLFWITYRGSQSSKRGDLLNTLGRRLLLYVAGVVLIAAPVYAAILFKAGFQNVFYDLFYVPARIYPKVRSLPFLTADTLRDLHHPLSWDGRIALESLIVFFPVFTILTTALGLLTSRRSRIFPTRWQRQAFSLLFLLTTLFFLKGLIRVGPVQMLQSLLICLTVLAILFGHLRQLSRPVTIALYTTVAFLALCTAPVLSHLLTFTRVNLRAAIHPQAKDSIHNLCHPQAGLERARCLLVEPDDLATIKAIEQRSTPDQTIYVGNGRHDRIFWNDVRLYFLSGRGSITRWYDLHPGVQTTLPIQDQIVDSIRQDHPPVVIVNTTWDDTIEPNQSQYPSGVTVLDDYIRTHYTPQATYGNITVLTPARQNFTP